MTRPSITVVTPWLNHPELGPDYDRAIELAPVEGDDRVIVVDDGSDPALESTDDAILVIRHDQTLGFARSCNDGLRAADTDAVLFLNNDVAARDSGWLARIAAAIEPGVLVGAQLRFDAHSAVDGVLFPYIDGWCIGGTRDDLLELGGFDETLEEPAYYSDNLLCFRARLAGMRLRHTPVPLEHKLGRTADEDRARATAATLANRERYQAEVRAAALEPA